MGGQENSVALLAPDVTRLCRQVCLSSADCYSMARHASRVYDTSYCSSEWAVVVSRVSVGSG